MSRYVLSVLAALALAFLLGAPSAPVAALPPTAGFAFADEVEAAVFPGGPSPAGRSLIAPINGPEPAPGVSVALSGVATPAAWLDWDALDRRADNRCEGDDDEEEEEEEDEGTEEAEDREEEEGFWAWLWGGVQTVIRWFRDRCSFIGFGLKCKF